MPKTNVNIENLTVGDYLCEVQYYQVAKINPKTVSLVNEKGIQINANKDLIAENMYSASQYQQEISVNLTEINAILEKAGHKVFTVNFNKKIKDKEIKEKLLNAIKDDSGNPLSYQEIEKKLAKISKELTKGEERTLIGYLLESSNEMGRSMVIDLEVSSEQYRIRQVDHRTINWLIINNIKYVVK